ncbi:MAG TPA: PaaI family thioesterase [Vicinamibacterales bacterium]|nr:PaaI family thioesterase [Vicinamibacterales bacterium]
MATRLEMMRRTIAGELPPPPIARLIGFRMTAIEPGRSRFELDADDRHHNPMGTLHGGVLCDIADVAMGSAYASTLDEGESFTTLELKINFLRPVRAAHLVAEGVLVQQGRTVGMVECAVTDERGRLVARATSTCLTLRGEQAQGR